MKRLISILVALSVWGIACAQPSVRIAHGPYLQQVTDDGFTVVWTTTMDAASWVEVAPDDGSHFYAAERPKYYDSHIGKRRIGRLHRVRVEGLAPGTTYRYRIMQQGVLCDEGNKRVVLGEGYGSDILKHKPYTATTLDQKKDRTEFWVVNDIHAQDSIFRLLLEGVGKAKPDFVCFNGDMLSSMESEKQLFEGYLNSAAELLTPAGIPIFATRGNHENRGSFSPRFLDYFPTSTGEVYYTFRQGPAYFVVLDCGEDKPDDHAEYNGLADYDAYRAEECAWLKKAVRSEEFLTASARIVLLHIPPAAGAWHGSVHLNELFVPVLNEAGIDLMLCGHDHRYSFHPAGERDAKFPIVVNDNRSCVRCDVADSLIRVRIAGPRDKTVHTHEFPLKPQFQP